MDVGKSFLVISQNLDELTKYAEKFAKPYNRADVFYLRAGEGETTIQVKETNAFMDMCYLAPVGDGKLMIIIDASTMTPQAQNKILKTVEDAPARTTFLLLATNGDKILNTVKSRCVTKYLPIEPNTNPLVGADILKTVKDVFGVEFDEKGLNTAKRYDIINAIAEVNRRVSANCNATNQSDLIIMEILKNEKNS